MLVKLKSIFPGLLVVSSVVGLCQQTVLAADAAVGKTTTTNTNTTNSGGNASATVTPDQGLAATENFGDIVLTEKHKVTKFVTPRNMQGATAYVVRIKRAEATVDENKAKEPTQADKIEARKLMYSANQSFFKGDFEGAWELVEKAEKLDPTFYRIKSMKGSLLYRIGSKDIAASLWQESLQLNPDQPDIKNLLDKTKKELGQ